MSKPGTTVTIDAEWLIARLDDLDGTIADIRRVCSAEVGRTATPAGINIRTIDWKTKDGQPARDDDPWAWAHGYHQDGPVKDETRQLVDEILRYGEVEVSGYVISLSGRDKRLLSRKPMGRQERRR